MRITILPSFFNHFQCILPGKSNELPYLHRSRRAAGKDALGLPDPSNLTAVSHFI